MEYTQISFEPNYKEGFLVPLVDINGVEIKHTTDVNEEELKRDYYRTGGILTGAVQMPDDIFIRYYIASLSIIGLYVVYRVLRR